MIFCFLISLIVFLLFENIYFYVLVFSISYFFILIFNISKFLTNFIKYYFFILFSTIIIILNYIWYYSINNTQQDWVKIFSWVVCEVMSKNRYIFESNWWKFLLKTDKTLYLNDNYTLRWYLQINWNSKNIFSFSLPSDINNPFIFQYDKWLTMKWINWEISVYNYLENWSSENLNTIELKKIVKKNVKNVFWINDVSWFLLWLLIWDKSLLSESTYDNFVDSWLVHIIAVSWWNIVMIVLFLTYILFFIPFYIRIFLIIIFISIYCLTCWLDSSVFRAWIMWLVTLLWLFAWRTVYIIDSIKISVYVLLLTNPFFLFYDLGFLLSYTALFWILAINYLLKNYKFPFKEYIIPTIGATIWTLPVILIYIWKLNLLWVLANFLVVPFIPLVLLIWIISLLSNMSILVEIEYFLLSTIINIAKFFSTNWIYLTNDNKLFISLFVIITIVIVTAFYLYNKKTVSQETGK